MVLGCLLLAGRGGPAARRALDAAALQSADARRARRHPRARGRGPDAGTPGVAGRRGARRPRGGERLYAAATATAFAPAAARAPAFDSAAGIDAAGADQELAAQADDASLDDVLRASMARVAVDLPGCDPTVQSIPVIVLDGVGFAGPLLDPAPEGPAALELWDATVALSRADGFRELSRPRGVHSLVASRMSAGRH